MMDNARRATSFLKKPLQNPDAGGHPECASFHTNQICARVK